jgi:hypothetical protein
MGDSDTATLGDGGLAEARRRGSSGEGRGDGFGIPILVLVADCRDLSPLPDTCRPRAHHPR